MPSRAMISALWNNGTFCFISSFPLTNHRTTQCQGPLDVIWSSCLLQQGDPDSAAQNYSQTAVESSPKMKIAPQFWKTSANVQSSAQGKIVSWRSEGTSCVSAHVHLVLSLGTTGKSLDPSSLCLPFMSFFTSVLFSTYWLCFSMTKWQNHKLSFNTWSSLFSIG